MKWRPSCNTETSLHADVSPRSQGIFAGEETLGKQGCCFVKSIRAFVSWLNETIMRCLSQQVDEIFVTHPAAPNKVSFTNSNERFRMLSTKYWYISNLSEMKYTLPLHHLLSEQFRCGRETNKTQKKKIMKGAKYCFNIFYCPIFVATTSTTSRTIIVPSQQLAVCCL